MSVDIYIVDEYSEGATWDRSEPTIQYELSNDDLKMKELNNKTPLDYTSNFLSRALRDGEKQVSYFDIENTDIYREKDGKITLDEGEELPKQMKDIKEDVIKGEKEIVFLIVIPNYKPWKKLPLWKEYIETHFAGVPIILLVNNIPGEEENYVDYDLPAMPFAYLNDEDEDQSIDDLEAFIRAFVGLLAMVLRQHRVNRISSSSDEPDQKRQRVAAARMLQLAKGNVEAAAQMLAKTNL